MDKIHEGTTTQWPAFIAFQQAEHEGTTAQLYENTTAWRREGERRRRWGL